MRYLERIYERLNTHRRLLAYSLYAAIAAGAYALAYLLRFEFAIPPEQARILAWTVGVVAGVRVAASWFMGLSSGRWRFISTSDIVRLVVTTSWGSVVLVGVLGPWSPVSVPRSVLLIEWVLTIFGTAGIWLTYRLTFERLRQARRSRGNGSPKRVVIVGAGEAGNLLAREIRRYPTGYDLVGFVDDDANKLGCRIQGAEVLGETAELSEIISVERVDEIILAIPSAGPKALRQLAERCEDAGVPFKVLPGIAEVLNGDIAMGQLRELRIDDLLGRTPVELELPELAEDLEERCVLITGAAGSIGSELARQVALHRPGRLVLLDQAESELYYLELEIRDRHPELDLVPVVGDIVDEAAIERLFDRYEPDRVFHAAAYKHVPLMEANVEEAVKNNVVGTRVVAEAAGRHRVGRFVLVSTDKAVQPANVMGSTKRLAELTVLDLQEEYPTTGYGAVRFGNVLGSNGSVIPIFEKQINKGKPLTVTHADATRYFMTIQEAVQLVLQASLLPSLKGHVAMLDMGEPVRIMDLALNFLRLSGLQPKEGENYRITGLRPGEKLHEELSAPHEGTEETAVPKVHLITTSSENAGLLDVLSIIARWEGYLANGHAGTVEAELKSLFHGLDNGVPAEHGPLASVQTG